MKLPDWYKPGYVESMASKGLLREDWRVTDKRVRDTVKGLDTGFWLLGYQLMDLRTRYEPFKEGILVDGVALLPSYDRGDLFLYRAGSVADVLTELKEAEERASKQRIKDAVRAYKALKEEERKLFKMEVSKR